MTAVRITTPQVLGKRKRAVNSFRPHIAAVIAAAAMLTLSSCSSMAGMPGMDHGAAPSASPTADAAATYNDPDVIFAQGMLPHHEQAVEMSEVILAKPDIDPRVTDLATAIKAAQEPEIAQLQRWLTAWGAEDIGSMDHGAHGMTGLMSEEDMAALEEATGVTASTLFLEQMIAHHQGAVDMAQTEVEEGENPDAITMAEEIVRSQTDEITVMQDILTTL